MLWWWLKWWWLAEFGELGWDVARVLGFGLCRREDVRFIFVCGSSNFSSLFWSFTYRGLISSSFFISSLSHTIHSFILFMAYQFGLLFLVTWSLSNSHLFWSFFFSVFCTLVPCPFCFLFWFYIFFCICFLKTMLSSMLSSIL